jgi:hypothetical protein
VIGHDIYALDAGALLRVVRALGQHRYVQSRLHLVHAFAIDAAAEFAVEALNEAAAWARDVLRNPAIDSTSKDERLLRRMTEAELVAVLGAFWGEHTEGRHDAKAKLEAHLHAANASVSTSSLPFDEHAEEEIFPLLIDSGWELVPLSSLDAEHHKGAIAAFGDALSFDVAKFEEQTAPPPEATLVELPAFGATELLHAFDDTGAVRAPFVVWTSGDVTYVDYVLRGVLRAGKVSVT